MTRTASSPRPSTVRPTRSSRPSPRRPAYSRARPRARGPDMAPERMRRVPGWLPAPSLALSLLAVGLTAYLTVTHYTDPTALACPDTGIVNCTAVTTSSWSVIAGVPVALLGLLWAVSMAAACSPWAWRANAAARWLDPLRTALATTGAAA